MNYNCGKLAKSLKKGLQAMNDYGYLNLQESGIMLLAQHGDETVIKKTKDEICITYDTEPHFYMALARSIGAGVGTCTIRTKIKEFGIMVDCSRNAVAKPDMLKKMICLMALLGYNYLELYTEDTYELPDEPYFGWQRGRYTASEIREVIGFADIFQIQVRPCIQTLAHLSQISYWKPYYDHMAANDTLLVGDEQVYDLIRKKLRYCKEVFGTNRINIGTDEGHNIALGKYLELHGYRDKHEVYLEHLKRIFAICKEEGIHPEFWADAFYKSDQDDANIKELFDGTQLPIYWDYTHTDKDFHKEKVEKLKSYAGKVAYAGGAWKWFGYVPDNEFSIPVIEASFDPIVEAGVEDILMTAWGDYGDECSVFAVIPSLWHAANKLYVCEVDEQKIVKELTGYSSEEWMVCEKMNHMVPEIQAQSNASRFTLHNDYLLGLLDYNIPENANEIYEKVYPELLRLSKRKSEFSYIFQSYATLAKVLTRKATFSKRIHKAYHEKDLQTMREMVKELKEIKKDMQKFYNTYRKQWLLERKSIGFEIEDAHIGCMIGRADTANILLTDYLEGRSDKVYELEEDRLEYSSGWLAEDKIYSAVLPSWSRAYTANVV